LAVAASAKNFCVFAQIHYVLVDIILQVDLDQAKQVG
jgi:hypothetical protein